ncbi:hypothetical protein DNL40_07890 [Xylanimonas oleitrophica]|uniref:Uncharacterized protein n=1 Tax=Xylanimonas oleitrophica TaxID=2607479 RepID=A0A2W5WR95_9MICO|nr:hypothetical protein [Xylanimonas oleitrophica]PZR53422.1 hypothetical protein DNL40_07890 [Xylanimonas oleitrophica]
MNGYRLSGAAGAGSAGASALTGAASPDATLRAACAAVDDALAHLHQASALGWFSPAAEAFGERLADVVHAVRHDAGALAAAHRAAVLLRAGAPR